MAALVRRPPYSLSPNPHTGGGPLTVWRPVAVAQGSAVGRGYWWLTARQRRLLHEACALVAVAWLLTSLALTALELSALSGV